jgi:hypothetical protein
VVIKVQEEDLEDALAVLGLPEIYRLPEGCPAFGSGPPRQKKLGTLLAIAKQSKGD